MDKLLEGVVVATDLDGTITPEDTLYKFFGEYGWLEEAKALDAVEPSSDVLLVLKKIASTRVLRKADMRRIAESVELFAGARDFFSQIEESGARVCILTASYEPIAQRIAERLGLERPVVRATRVAERRGKITGIEGPVMEAGEKARALLETCAELKVPLSKVVGIADSPGDRQFMDLVANAGGECFWVKKPDFKRIQENVLKKFGAGAK